LVSGPVGVAAILRRGLLDKPYSTPSLPLDIGYSDAIPWYIRFQSERLEVPSVSANAVASMIAIG
jgi:hypothetical protein